MAPRRKRFRVPGAQEMARAIKKHEVNVWRSDLLEAEKRRNYLHELENINATLYGGLSSDLVKHRLHNRSEHVRRAFMESLLGS